MNEGDIDWVDPPLFAAVSLSDADLVRQLVDAGEDVNQIDARPVLGAGNTALHRAAANGNLKIVKTLIELGANPNLCCDNGNTALIHACDGDYFSVAEYLVNSGANPQCTNTDGYSALGRVPGSSTDFDRFVELLGGSDELEKIVKKASARRSKVDN